MTLDLSNRMKDYEKKFDSQVPHNEWILVRVDGVNFSKVLKRYKLHQPFDSYFSHIMQKCMEYVCEEYNFPYAFTSSDEISFCWRPTQIQSQLTYSGRINKLCSLFATTCSIFLTEEMRNDYQSFYGTFDCRVFSVPSIHEACNYFYSRYLDCHRNSIQRIAQHLYGHDYCQNKSVKELKKTIPFQDYPLRFLHGIFNVNGFDNCEDLTGSTHEFRLHNIFGE